MHVVGRKIAMSPVIQDGFIAFSCIQLYTYKTLFTYRHTQWLSVTAWSQYSCYKAETINTLSAKSQKIHLEMEWVDL